MFFKIEVLKNLFLKVAKFLRTSVPQNTSGRLLLKSSSSKEFYIELKTYHDLPGQKLSGDSFQNFAKIPQITKNFPL